MSLLYRLVATPPVPGVAIPGCQPQHLRPAGGDVDRRALGPRAAKDHLCLLRLVVLAREIDRAVLQEPVDDLDRLGEPGVPVVGRETERLVVGVGGVAGADSEDVAASGDLVDRLGHLGREPG